MSLYREVHSGMETALSALDKESRQEFTADVPLKKLAEKALRETLWVLSYFTTLVIKDPWDTIVHGLKTVNFPDLSMLRRLSNEKRPIVIVSPHLSTSFLLPVLLAMQGFRVTMVEDLIHSSSVRRATIDWLGRLALRFKNTQDIRKLFKQHNPQAYSNIKHLEQSEFDLELMSVAKASLARLTARLSQGRVVILFNDYRHVKGRNELTDTLFGMEACVARGAASLVSQSNGVAFGCAISKRNSIMHLSLGQPIEKAPAQSVDHLALVLFRESRAYIYSNPQQWTLWTKVNSKLKA